MTTANCQGLLLINMLLHTLIFICPASDHLLVSLPYDWGRAARTREMHKEEETRHVLPFGAPGSKALWMPAPIPDTTVGPYLLSVPCLPKCSLLTWSLSGLFGRCHVAAFSQPARVVSFLPVSGKAIPESRNHIFSPPRTNCPVESTSNAKTGSSSSPSPGLHPELFAKKYKSSSDAIFFFSRVELSTTSGQEKYIALPNLVNVFPWDSHGNILETEFCLVQMYSVPLPS